MLDGMAQSALGRHKALTRSCFMPVDYMFANFRGCLVGSVKIYQVLFLFYLTISVQ
jgi:hypothetical protein